MKRIVLHVGNPKTGTTAIQQYCHAHETDLLKDGLNYSKVGRDYYKVNHKAFHFAILKSLDKPHRAHSDARVDDLDLYISELDEELESVDSDVHLISFEGLSSLAMFEESEAPLKDLIHSFPKHYTIEVVIYIRDPWETLMSNYNERSKRRNFTPPFLDFAIKSHDMVLDQSFAYSFFLKTFGDKKVTAKLYGEKNGADFISDFFHTMGIHHIAKEQTDRPINTSLAKSEIEFSRIRAVQELRLPKNREKHLLYGDPLLSEEQIILFSKRLEAINKNNIALFRNEFNRDVKEITLSEIIRTERDINVDSLRSYYIHKEGFFEY